jgi:hypothetical protein
VPILKAQVGIMIDEWKFYRATPFRDGQGVVGIRFGEGEAKLVAEAEGGGGGVVTSGDGLMPVVAVTPHNRD